MGDGRYYTFYQFFDVALVTMLAIFVASSIVYCYYRRTHQTKRFDSHIKFGLISSFFVLRTIEIVIPSMVTAQVLRNLQTAILLILLMQLACMKRAYLSKKSKWVALFFLAIILCGAILGTFVSQYAFHHIQYSETYKIGLLILFGLNLICIIYDTYHKKYNRIYGRSQEALLLLPLAVYLILVMQNNRHVDYVELVLFFCITLMIYFELYPHSELGLAMLLFDKIGDMSKSYIFVMDLAGHVVYQNKAAKEANCFKRNQKIQLQDMTNIFATKDVSKSNELGKEYIIANFENKTNYFAYKIGKLQDSDRIIGSIMTITDITDLIELLGSLEDKKEKLKRANEKLQNYSNVVYHLEKEKEMNNLLEKVILSRDAQLNELSQLMNYAKEHLEDTRFVQCIDEAITKSNAVLEEVRATVSAYREYYGDSYDKSNFS